MYAALAASAVFAVLHGLTEFLPISRSAHFALADILFGLKPPSSAMLVALHVGTLAAMLVVLRERILGVLVAVWQMLRHPSRIGTIQNESDVLVTLVAIVPMAVIELLLQGFTEGRLATPLATGLGLLLTGICLSSARWVRRGALDSPGLAGALLMGLALGAGGLPGVSRTGVTIVAGLWLGLRPERAFQLTMLASLLAGFGAVLLSVPGLMATPATLGPVVVGAIVSFAVGASAVTVLRYAVVRERLFVFAAWVVPLAVATLALARAWPTCR